jgi:hypothetical protein
MDRTKRLAAALFCFLIVIVALPFTALSTEVEFRNHAPYAVDLWPQTCDNFTPFTLSPSETKRVTLRDICLYISVDYRKAGDPGYYMANPSYALWTGNHPKDDGVVWTMKKCTSGCYGSEYLPQWSDR